ncbi:transcriptional regulator [Burkholderia territorii]|uniref:transcriptional regulator n=1 Tax=Burkholderia territorii TaxID=1503055 RepID=UPI001E5098D3|nr:transcriptional regulator [Burkholderia territorii]
MVSHTGSIAQTSRIVWIAPYTLAMANALNYRAATTAPITARQASSQGAFVITALNRRTHIRAFLVASVAYLNLSQAASAAYTESWMSDHDVKEYAQQVKHSPVAAHAAAPVKPGRQPASSTSNARAAAQADAKPVSKPHAAAGKTGKVEHAAGVDPKTPVVAKPKVARTAHQSATIKH